jgi:hypothetical protein
MSVGRILAEKLGKSHQLIFVTPWPQIWPSKTHTGQMTNPKQFIFHCRNISRDDGMDENGIDWLYGCTLIGFWLKSWANHISWFLLHPDHKPDPVWLTWAIWPTENHSLSSSGHVKRWWYGWEWSWLALWISAGRILAENLGKSHQLTFVTPDHKSDPAWLTWARWPTQNHSLSSSGHIKRWWY